MSELLWRTSADLLPVCYLQFLHGELGAVLLGALHQHVQGVAVILPMGAQRLLPDGLLDALLQGVSCPDALQTHTITTISQSPDLFPAARSRASTRTFL